MQVLKERGLLIKQISTTLMLFSKNYSEKSFQYDMIGILK